MYFLYSTLQLITLIIGFPYFAYKALVHKKYIQSIPQRLGYLPADLCSQGHPLIWIHGCSVGETLAVYPLMARISELIPSATFVVSTITITGQTVARSRLPKNGAAFYFPYDFTFITKRVLAAIRPSVVIILETEIWPNFVRECHRRRIPLILANGRLSEKSLRGYSVIRRFMKRVLGQFTLLIMQTEEDAQRMRSLGVASEKVIVSGNLKYDRGPMEKERLETLADQLDRELKLSEGPPLIIAGSTHAGEERLLLDVLKRVQHELGPHAVRLLIAPRHPERFGDVEKLIEKFGFRFVRRSMASTNGQFPDVVLLDTVGELAAVYKFAHVVFVGGTLVPKGGQSILEPALYSKPIVVGPYADHFREVVRDFTSQEAIVQLPLLREADIPAVLSNTLIDLLRDAKKAAAMGRRARTVLDRNQGAILRTVAPIKKFIPN